MDPSGKLIYTRGQDVLSFNFQTLQDTTTTPTSDGARIPIASKDIGSTEIFPTVLLHSPNGRFVTVVGDGEYITYTALAWRNKAFGIGSSFAWAPDSNTYAVLEGRTKLRIYKNFKEKTTGGMKGAGAWAIDGLHGGTLLAARGTGFVVFWDWESGEVVRRVDVDAKNVSEKHLRPSRPTHPNDRSSGLVPRPLLLSSRKTRVSLFASTEKHTRKRWRVGKTQEMKVSQRLSRSWLRSMKGTPSIPFQITIAN